MSGPKGGINPLGKRRWTCPVCRQVFWELERTLSSFRKTHLRICTPADVESKYYPQAGTKKGKHRG
jgi:hypothetical protein